jgi:hypothetical protein
MRGTEYHAERCGANPCQQGEACNADGWISGDRLK